MHWRIQRGLEETCALADHARTGGVAGCPDLLGGEVEGCWRYVSCGKRHFWMSRKLLKPRAMNKISTCFFYILVSFKFFSIFFVFFLFVPHRGFARGQRFPLSMIQGGEGSNDTFRGKGIWWCCWKIGRGSALQLCSSATQMHGSTLTILGSVAWRVQSLLIGNSWSAQDSFACFQVWVFFSTLTAERNFFMPKPFDWPCLGLELEL